MKRLLLFLSPIVLFSAFSPWDSPFHKEQMKAPKVLSAYQEKWPGIKKRLRELKIDSSDFQVFIRVFKAEKQLEVWVKNSGGKVFKPFGNYAICASSGELGPKRREGDGQVPEGFYQINVFNPYSNYYVSLGLSYPNKSDRLLSPAKSLGGAIMIHGNCVTIGCIPITDDRIKEVYILAEQARSGGQQEIPVHIFPEKLTDSNMAALEREHTADKPLLVFWENLKTGYDYFEKGNKLPEVTIGADGKYLFR